MSEDTGKKAMSKDTGKKLSPQLSGDGQLEPREEMFAVLRDHIEAKKQAAEVAREGFKILHASNERQFEFQMEKLRLNDEDRKSNSDREDKKLDHKTKTTWFRLTSALVIVFFVLGMIFWGDDGQQDNATKLTLGILSYGGAVCIGFVLGRRPPG